MKLLVGLWNPWDEYKFTKHNIWFLALEKIKDDFGFEDFRFEKKFGWQISKGKIFSQDVILLKPMEYMNLSGQALSRVKNFFKLQNDDILVIFDDMDLEAWVYRYRTWGSSWGHNWIKSIIWHIWTQFPRLKIWIWRPKFDAVEHVLWKFWKDEVEKCLEDDKLKKWLQEFFNIK